MHYPGIQQDELISAAPLYAQGTAAYELPVAGHPVPIMLMSYLGALKTWLYAPVFRLVRPSYLSVRLPALLLGCFSIWLLFHWLDTAHSRRAAWIATLLIATDTTFLLTTCFDWGPVALQHVLTLLAVVLVLRFHSRRNVGSLAAASFCFGLAFWDKALFGWIAGGLLLATIAVFPPEILTSITWRNAAVSVGGFIIGASPLITYNVLAGFPTFHATSGFGVQEIYPKRYIALDTWEGAALFGYLVNEDNAAAPHAPRNWLEKSSFALESRLGEHRRNWMSWAGCAAALLLIPALWWKDSRRIVAFCIIVTGIGVVLMGLTIGAGGSAHHVVLLWPFPHAAVAVIFTELSRRAGVIGQWLVAIGVIGMIGANLLVTDQYLYQFARDGAAGSWNDSIYRLADDLRQTNIREVAILDWGISNPLEVLGQGRPHIAWIGGADLPWPGILMDPQILWISHTNDSEQFTGVNAKFYAFSQQAGFKEVSVRTYADSNGRPTLQSFRLQKRQ